MIYLTYMAYITELLRDEWNLEHIARHNVEPEEVVEVALSGHYTKRARGGTYLLVGQTQAGRYLTVIVAPRGGNIYYVVTARDSTREDRRRYDQWR